MEVSEDVKKSDHSSKSLKNKEGNYPAWVSNRKIQKIKAKAKARKAPPEMSKVNKRKKRKFL